MCKWDINWYLAPGNDRQYPWNCDKVTVACFLNNSDGDNDEGVNENNHVEENYNIN